MDNTKLLHDIGELKESILMLHVSIKQLPLDAQLICNDVYETSKEVYSQLVDSENRLEKGEI